MVLVVPTYLAAKPLDIEIQARSAVLMNAATGAILFEKQPFLPVSPASTTKIATALYVIEHEQNLGRMVTVSAECLKHKPSQDRERFPAHWLESDGTMLGIKRGEMVTLETLLYGMMLVSGNDAANVAAEVMGGSVPQFMELLNEYLQGMGCQNTHFANPHGLTHSAHYCSAYDMALITQRALRNHTFRQIVSTLKYTKPKSNKQAAREILHTNPLLKAKSRHYYPKAIGVKSGYTAAAQRTLVAAAEHEGRTLIAVVFGTQTSDERFQDAKKLFDAAFAQKKERRRLIGSDYTFIKEIDGSKLPLRANLAKALCIEYFPAEESECKAILHWQVEGLPIHKGQKVGEVEIVDLKGTLLQKGDLCASCDVKGNIFWRVKEWLTR